MSLGRMAAVIVGAAVLSISGGCLGSRGADTSTSPSTVIGGRRALSEFTVEDGVRFTGINPAPLLVNGVTYVYQDTFTDSTTVEASSDGLVFVLKAASFPAGVSRSIVALPNGGFRMYYFTDNTSVDVRSAVSNDGLHWAAEGGIRISIPSIGAVRATVLPRGGFRLYFPTITGLSSALSTDGLTFVGEGPLNIPTPDLTSVWGASAAVYLNGQFHMVMTKVPFIGPTELWHAASTDGRNWTVNGGALDVNPGVPVNQPAWSIIGNTTRIYFRSQSSAVVNMIASGIVRF